MRALVTFLSVATALLWSAVVWGGYGLLLMSSDFLARGAWQVGLPAEVGSAAGMLSGLLQDYGTAATAALWAIGLLAILLLRALVNWVIGMARPREAAPVVAAPVPAAPPAVPAPDAVEQARSAPRPAPVPSQWGRGAGR